MKQIDDTMTLDQARIVTSGDLADPVCRIESHEIFGNIDVVKAIRAWHFERIQYCDEVIRRCE